MWNCNTKVKPKEFVKTHFRTSGSNTYTAPYKSLSITSLSNNVTVDGQAIPRSFTVTVGSDENELISNNTVVTGDDYFVTIVR